MTQQPFRIRCRIVVALLSITVMGRSAITIDYIGGGPDLTSRNITYLPEVGVPDGNEVRIGYFTGGFDVAANAGNLGALSANWHQYDNTFTLTLTINATTPGCFSDSQVREETQFDNRKIYLWAFKTADNAAVSPDNGNVTHYGLYSSTILDPTWVFPPADSVGTEASKTIDAFQVNERFWGTIPEGSSSLQLAPVPEPSAFGVIMGLTALGLAQGIRRHRSSTVLLWCRRPIK